MNKSVILEITGLTKAFVTEVANVPLVITANMSASGDLVISDVRFCGNMQLMHDRMTSFMTDETATLSKGPATQVTNVRSLVGVNTSMLGKIRRVLKSLATEITRVRPLLCVNTSVSLKITRLTKRFITHFAYV